MLKRWIWQLTHRIKRPLSLIKRSETEQEQVASTFEPEYDNRPRWVMMVIGSLVLTLSGTVVWACVAELDVVVSARGRIDSLSSAQTLKSIRGGRITAVLAKDGDVVQSGQLLVQIDKSDLFNQLLSLKKQREPFAAQAAVLRQASAALFVNPQDSVLATLPEIAALLRQRNLINAQLTNNPSALAPDQLISYNLFVQRLRTIESERQIQIAQAQVQSIGTNAQIENASAQLRIERDKLSRLGQLFAQGGISRNGVLDQVGATNDVQSRIIQARTQQAQVLAEQQKTQTTTQQQLDEVYRQLLDAKVQADSQIANKLREAQEQLIKLDAQIKQIDLDLKAQEVVAPTAGTVTGLEVTLPGGIVQPGQPLLQVIPNESIVATVEISPADIANLKVGTPVEVRIDALPFTEFGAIKGSIANISSNTIQSQNGQPFFRAQIRLDQPILERGAQKHPLKNGMTISAQMKTRTQRPIELVLGSLINLADSAKSGR